VDPIFGKQISFYLFALPAWQLITGLAAIASRNCLCDRRFFFIFVTGSTTILSGRRSRYTSQPWRGFLHCVLGFLLLVLAMAGRISLDFERLFDEHTIFGGVTYTDAHVMLPWNARSLCRAYSWCCDLQPSTSWAVPPAAAAGW